MAYLTVQQVAEKLGVTRSTIDHMIKAYVDFPYIKLGNSKQSKVRIDEEKLEEWLNRTEK